MELEEAIGAVVALCGGSPKLVPAVAVVFRKAGVKETVPDGVLKRVLTAGRALKKLGVA